MLLRKYMKELIKHKSKYYGLFDNKNDRYFIRQKAGS